MDTRFVEIGKSEIKRHYPCYFHDQACYFKAEKNSKTLGCYGIISRTNGQNQPNAGEAFLMMKTLNSEVLSKGFFISLFIHMFSLGYSELWTWTKGDRLARLLGRFKDFGIERARCPPWDDEAKIDPAKKWFVKTIKESNE
jgi:hypothetical protein